MTGSALVPVIVPIVALPALAFWLGLCFYAGSHPFWRHQPPAHQQVLAGPGRPAAPLPPGPQPAGQAGPVLLAGPPADGT